MSAGGAVLLGLALVAAQEAHPRLPTSEFDDAARQAVERGLAWLAAQQQENGAWNSRIGHKLFERYEQTEYGPHVGITGLAGLALLAAGNSPGQGPYGEAVERALGFVLSCVRPEDGYITHRGSRMYEHAYATMFLAQVYGVSQREDVRDGLERAIRLVVYAQNHQGGWRYSPQPTDADMSVTVSTLQALRAAHQAGVYIPVDVIERGQAYVRSCAAREGQLGFNYQSERREGGADTRTTFPLTACGLVSLFSAGEYRTPLAVNALSSLRRFMQADLYGYHPSGQRALDPSHYFFYYGHFYAAQAFYLSRIVLDRDDLWRWYWDQIRPILLREQQPEGFWTDGPQGIGNTFATPMALLILQMPVEWLPIFHR